MEYQEVLRTELQRGRLDVVKEKRTKLIKEAIGWESGTQENKKKYSITKLENGLEVYFLKPGEEAARKTNPRPHDMTPKIGDQGDKLEFKHIWNYFLKISLVNPDVFKAVLTLVYRNAYLLDHVEEDGLIRYRPNNKIVSCITEIETRVSGIIPFGLMGLLHFLDILGWNEDVKYHVVDDSPIFASKTHPFARGRINTLLTCIRVSYITSDFVRHVLERRNESDIDFMPICETMDQLAKRRGVCPAGREDLKKWLSPYIFE